ncbi:MAG: hypothetical protein LCH60_15015 [Actinobacteria bacterium]|nr:hypothetical protein [Actinomycetota bacterium]
MSSKALLDLVGGIDEVRALRTHFPVPSRGLPTGDKALAVKAHGRACVVLLTSHLERYIYAVNEEAIEWVNSSSCDLSRFPEVFLLQHSQRAVDELAARNWENRAAPLREFVSMYGALWTPPGRAGTLKHGETLTWMKSPAPENLERYYRMYGIKNIFHQITRKPGPRSLLYLGLRELVEKRNNIAHGDAATQALPADVTRYLSAVGKFADSADKALARSLRSLVGAGATAPW